jgi:hypothetical protein
MLAARTIETPKGSGGALRRLPLDPGSGLQGRQQHVNSEFGSARGPFVRFEPPTFSLILLDNQQARSPDMVGVTVRSLPRQPALNAVTL